jgi:YVTN family beta-propeller protein
MHGCRWLVALVVGIGVLAGAGPVFAAQVVYAPNISANDVSVLDAVAGAPDGAAIPVAAGPYSVAVTSDATRVYVSNFNANAVSVIDAATRAIVATVPVGVEPFGVAMSPDDSLVYVANFQSNTVSVLAAATDTVIATIPVGSSPYGVAVSPDGTRAYAVNESSDDVTVIDTATSTVIDTIAVGGAPLWPTLTPDGTRLLVTSQFSGLWAIDPLTDTVVATGGSPASSIGAEISRDGATAYLGAAGELAVVGLPSLAVSRTVSLTDNPLGIGLTADGARLFFKGNVGTWLVDTAPGGAVTQLDGSPGAGVAVSPAQLAPAFTATPAGSHAQLDASSSIATDGVAEYRWDFGDGRTQTTTVPLADHGYAAAGTYTVRLTLLGADGCDANVFTGRTATCHVGPAAQHQVTVSAPDASTPPASPPMPASAPIPAPCRRAIVLTDVSWHGGKVDVAGVAAAPYAGQPVAILRGDTILAHATVAQDGSFRTTLKLAPRGRLQAVVAGQRSLALKVTRQLQITGRRALSQGRVRVTGHLPGGRQTVALHVQTGCTPSPSHIVRSIHADRRGRFAVTLAAPSTDVAVYRLASRRPRSVSLPVVLEAAGSVSR